MIHVDPTELMSGLDDDLLDEYMTKKTANLRRLERRQAIAKHFLAAAACLVVVLSVTAKVSFDCRYPYIPLTNAVGDVSVRYVPEWMVTGNRVSYIPDYLDSELFEQADYVFSGTVSKVEHIKIVLGSQSSYHSIVTIQIDHLFRGNDLNEIRLLTPTIYNNENSSNTVLDLIKEDRYGIFIVRNIGDNQTISLNSFSVYLSDLADTKIYDNYSFAFLYDESTDRFICYDTIHDHNDRFFSSLTTYDPTSVYEYIQRMTDMD